MWTCGLILDCRSTSVTRIVHGSAAPTRIPMACCANTSRRGLISVYIAQMISRRWRRLSIQGREKPWDGKLVPRPWIGICGILGELNVLLRRPFESSHTAGSAVAPGLAFHGGKGDRRRNHVLDVVTTAGGSCPRDWFTSCPAL